MTVLGMLAQQAHVRHGTILLVISDLELMILGGTSRIPEVCPCFRVKVLVDRHVARGSQR